MASKAALAIALLLTANTGKAASAINSFSLDAQKKLDRLKSAATWDSWGNKNIKAGTLLAAPIVAATVEAAKLEKGISSVAKVTGTDFGSKAFDALTTSAMNTSEELGKMPGEVSDLMFELASGGVAIDKLDAMAIKAGKIGVAFDVSAGEAGDAWMTIQNAMNATEDDTSKIMDAMNAVADKFGGKASYLLEFMKSGGAGVAKSLNISGVAMQAYGNTFKSVGISASESGTVMESFQRSILKNAEVANIFNKAGGGSKGMVAILEAAKASGNAADWLQKKEFGNYGAKIALMAQNMDGEKGLKNQLAFLNDDKNVIGSADKEYANVSQTTSKQFERMKVAAYNAAIKLGDTLLPVARQLMAEFKPIVKSITDWITANPKLTATIMKAAAGFAVGRIALGGLQKGIGGTINTIKGFKKAFEILGNGHKAVKRFYTAFKLSNQLNSFARGGSIISKAVKGIGSGFTKFGSIALKVGKALGSGLVKSIMGFGRAFAFVGKLMMANPIILIITGIAVAAFLIIKNWDKIKPWLVKFWNSIKSIFSKAWEGIKTFFVNTWKNIKDIFSGAFEGIKFLFLNFSPIGLIVKHWEPIKKFFVDLWEGVKNSFSKAIDWISNKFSWVNKNILKPIGLGFGDSDINVNNSTTPKPTASINPINRSSNSMTFSPVIQLSGSATEQDGQMIAAMTRTQFEQMMKQYNHDKDRRSLS